MLSRAGEEVKVLAGGTDLLVNLKKNQGTCTGLVNIKTLPGLTGINFTALTMRIGALTKISAIVENESLQAEFPVLRAAAQSLGTPQIRNLATVGGNLCNASPAADLAVALLVYGAKVFMTGPHGTREMLLEQFITGPGQTALAKGEILTAVELVRPAATANGAFMKHGKRKSHEIAIVNLAVLLLPDQDHSTIAEAKIALGAVAPTPLRARRAEEILINQQAGDSLWERAAVEAMAEVHPIDDARSTAGYRTEMVGVLLKRVLRTAWEG